MDGVWAVEFSATGRHGTGIAVIQGNKMAGGDNGFVYTGAVVWEQNKFTTRLHIQNYNPNVESVFAGLTDFYLQLEGEISGQKFTAMGSIEGMANAQLNVVGLLKDSF